jgi:hypothetical protein
MIKDEFVLKRVIFKIEHPVINLIINNRITILIKSWMFQGYLDLSVNEKIYKIMFDLSFIVIAMAMVDFSFITILISFLIIHSINWVTNDHFMDNMYHLGLFKMNENKMKKSIMILSKIIAKQDMIIFAGIYGRPARGEPIRSASDIDLRIIIKPGFNRRFKACFLGHYIRSVASFKLIPVDLNIWNNLSDLKRMRKEEKPIILKLNPTIKDIII